MTKAQKLRIRLAALTLGLAGFLVPVALSPGEVVEANDACASGACCREAGSLCQKDGNNHFHYYEASRCDMIDA